MQSSETTSLKSVNRCIRLRKKLKNEEIHEYGLHIYLAALRTDWIVTDFQKLNIYTR